MGVVEVKDAYKKFMGSFVLDGLNLSIKKGDKIALLGPNGAGKTTLVRSMLGFYHLDRGEITINGLSPTKDRVEILKSIGFIPQLPPPIKLTIKELLQFVERSSNTPAKRVEELASAMKLELKSQKNKPFFKLSGGMKQKLLIAIALAKRSEIFIFDEPTASLDPKAREDFYTLLKSIDYEYLAIYITHRAEELEGLINREIYMELGKVVDDREI
jgi:ABC-2 type transport system ATP-binding protein